MIGRMMACGTSSSAVVVNSVANQSPTRLEMRLMVCFHFEVPFVVGTVHGLLAIQPIRMAAHRRITAEMLITLLLSWRRIGPDVRRGGG